jgi:prepilin-type N-terminal cleavage/methylation domain-containing protein
MHPYRRLGYTLIELLIVIAIMGLAAAIVLPALLPPRPDAGPLQTIIASARQAAVRRGEVIYLRIEPTGAWHMEGGGSPLEGDRIAGRIAPVATSALTLLVSPSGACAFDVRSAYAARVVRLDPLTCTVTIPLPVSSS